MQPHEERELFQALGRIEQKIDGHIESLTKHVEADEKTNEKIDGRLVKLERVWLKAAGALALALFVGEAAIALISH